MYVQTDNEVVKLECTQRNIQNHLFASSVFVVLVSIVLVGSSTLGFRSSAN